MSPKSLKLCLLLPYVLDSGAGTAASVCLLITFVSPAETAEPIEMPIGGWTRVGPRNHVLHGVEITPTGRGNFGVVRPTEKALGVSVLVHASKGIIQFSITARQAMRRFVKILRTLVVIIIIIIIIDAELVANVVVNIKRGKVAGLDGITSEHLLFSHALLPCILAKLFNLMISIGYVPLSFGQSYTVPLLKE